MGRMDAEVSSRIGAEYGERSPERVTQRNGYWSRAWDPCRDDGARLGPERLHGRPQQPARRPRVRIRTGGQGPRAGRAASCWLLTAGGVGAWADAARGVLTLTGQGDDRTLAISKANWGRAYVQTQLAPVVNDAGALVGFNAGSDGWGRPAPKDAAPVKKETYD